MTEDSLLELLGNSKKVLVLGAGQTGQTAALVFNQARLAVNVLDEGKVGESSLEELRSFGIPVREQVELDDYELDDFENYDLALISPGIPETSELVVLVKEAGVPVLSDLDLYQALIGKAGVAVTGTNGKTTVSHLINQMLSASSKRSTLLGNVGRAVSSMLLRPLLCPGLPKSGSTEDVVEVSSYQLLQKNIFSPRVGVFLNFKADHLERHGSIESYFAAKAKLLEKQAAEDFAVLSSDEPRHLELAKTLKPKVCLLYTSPSPRDATLSRMPSSA